MQFSYACALLPLVANAANIVLSNDDGWAEINIRTFYESLLAAGEDVIVSAPAENESGTGEFPSQLPSPNWFIDSLRLLNIHPLSPDRSLRVFKLRKWEPSRRLQRLRHAP